MIARGYEQVLAEVRAPLRGLTARVPVQRDQVVLAAPDIERLIERLRDVERPVDESAIEAARDVDLRRRRTLLRLGGAGNPAPARASDT